MMAECYAGLMSKGEGFLLHFFDLSDAVLTDRLEGLLSRHLPAPGRTEPAPEPHNERAGRAPGGERGDVGEVAHGCLQVPQVYSGSSPMGDVTTTDPHVRRRPVHERG